MTITIMEGMRHQPDYLYMTSKDEQFKKAWGDGLRISRSRLFSYMSDIADWANNALGEACLFEVE